MQLPQGIKQNLHLHPVLLLVLVLLLLNLLLPRHILLQKKDTSVINVSNHFQGAMSFKTTKCLNMDQVLAATCVIMSLFNLLLH